MRRLRAVHCINAPLVRLVDVAYVSCETEYFGLAGLRGVKPERALGQRVERALRWRLAGAPARTATTSVAGESDIRSPWE